MKSPDSFRRDYEWGLEWEDRVVSLIQKCNPYVEQPPKFSKVVHGRVVGFTDQGDITAQTLISCKRRRVEFTGQQDYPYPTVFVDEEYKLIPDHIPHDVYYAMPLTEKLASLKWFHSYWIGSADMRHVALIIPASKPYWTLEERFSPQDNRNTMTWACPKGKAIFGSVEDLSSLLTWT